MQLDFVIERLRAQVPCLKAVGGAADLDAALAGAVAVPAAFVVPVSDEAGPHALVGRYAETTQQVFGVMLAVANLRDARGAAALASLAPMRDAVRCALAGWVPDEATGEPVSKGRGQLLRFDGDGRLWWMDQFHWKSYFYRSPL